MRSADSTRTSLYAGSSRESDPGNLSVGPAVAVVACAANPACVAAVAELAVEAGAVVTLTYVTVKQYGPGAAKAVGDAADSILRAADGLVDGLLLSKARDMREGDGTRGKTIEQIRADFKDKLTPGELNKLVQQVEKIRGLRNKQKRGS